MTYRYRGHSMSDPAKYRSKDEVTTMRAEHDPIEQVKARILEKRYGTEESLKAIETEVRAIVTEAADFATADAEPDAVGALDRHLRRRLSVHEHAARRGADGAGRGCLIVVAYAAIRVLVLVPAGRRLRALRFSDAAQRPDAAGLGARCDHGLTVPRA